MVEANAADFEPRPAFDIPGFPMPASEVLRYRDDALSFLDLAGHSFDPSHYDDRREAPALPSYFHDNLFHFPLAGVVQTDRPTQAMADPLIDVRTGLHLRRFVRVGDSVSALEFVGDDGSVTKLRPSTVVLSMGGVENNRHLLVGAAEGVIPNEHDLLGRYFMDHPHVRLGYLRGTDVERWSYYDFQQIRDTYVLRGHGIDPCFAQSADLLRFSIDLVGRHELDGTATGFALAQLKDGVERRDPRLVGASLVRALRRPLDAARLARVAMGGSVHHTGLGGWSDEDARLLPIGVASVESMFEQRPSWDNRIRLDGRETDRYGMAKPVLQWSFSDCEVSAIRRATEVTSDAFEAAGLGPLTTMPELGEGPIPRAGTGLHHLGGTRMHADPTRGVVDEHGRMHDLDNVYLAGSSVFPTSAGYANPTFTILEMALRLADHLSGEAGPSLVESASY